MNGEIRTAAQLQERIKQIVGEAFWGGVTPKIIAAILEAEAEIARNK